MMMRFMALWEKQGETLFVLILIIPGYKELFASNRNFILEENGYELMAERVKGIAQYLGFQVQWLEQPKEGACVIHLCENIFEIGRYVTPESLH